MIYLAVLSASLCVFGGGLWLGWACRSDSDAYWSGYRDALHALGFVYEDVS